MDFGRHIVSTKMTLPAEISGFETNLEDESLPNTYAPNNSTVCLLCVGTS